MDKMSIFTDDNDLKMTSVFKGKAPQVANLMAYLLHALPRATTLPTTQGRALLLTFLRLTGPNSNFKAFTGSLLC